MVARLVKTRIYEVMFLPFRSRVIKRYLDSNAVTRLQIGTGPNVLHGWLNTDVYPETGLLDSLRRVVFLDATKPFPFPDRSIDYVFSEHVIEHLAYNSASNMLGECYRVLRPGGKIRIATPDLHAIISLDGSPMDRRQGDYCRFVVTNFASEIDADGAAERVSMWEALTTNIMFYAHDHKFIYNRETLQATMSAVGFTNIKWESPGVSDDPILCGLEMHGKRLGNEEINKFETMVVEGSRPA
jgi:SAM-dependent methyltransferase